MKKTLLKKWLRRNGPWKDRCDVVLQSDYKRKHALIPNASVRGCSCYFGTNSNPSGILIRGQRSVDTEGVTNDWCFLRRSLVGQPAVDTFYVMRGRMATSLLSLLQSLFESLVNASLGHARVQIIAVFLRCEPIPPFAVVFQEHPVPRTRECWDSCLKSLHAIPELFGCWTIETWKLTLQYQWCLAFMLSAMVAIQVNIILAIPLRTPLVVTTSLIRKSP